MPTKFLVIETPQFQLGANAGDKAEKTDPAGFPARLKQHIATNSKDILFVLAPEELRYQGVFQEAANGPASVSVAFFPKVEDAIRFLPSIFLFASETRTIGVKDALTRGSAIYTENFFNGNSVGSKLDPVFAYARRHLSPLAATNAWGSIQSLVFHGLQNLPEQGEKGTGEKVDVQIGADEKLVLLSVRFDLPAEKAGAARGSPLVSLPRSAAGIFESRYVADGKKIEFNCLFYRSGGPARPIEIQTFHGTSALENPETVQDYSFRTLSTIQGDVIEEKTVVKARGGFKKKFSAQIDPAAAAAAEPVTTISPDTAVPESKVVVSGNAKIGNDAIMVRSKPVVVPGEKETVIVGGASNAELDLKVRGLETTLRQKDEMIAKLNKDLAALNDPHAKRDVITNIKDTQSEGLKQTVKALESEIEEAKEREKELMKMVDKAVQMKDEAAKKIKELELKVKQAGGTKGSKEQMLEKQLEEAKRQNKELAARLGDMMAKQRAGKAA